MAEGELGITVVSDSDPAVVEGWKTELLNAVLDMDLAAKDTVLSHDTMVQFRRLAKLTSPRSEWTDEKENHYQLLRAFAQQVDTYASEVKAGSRKFGKRDDSHVTVVLGDSGETIMTSDADNALHVVMGDGRKGDIPATGFVGSPFAIALIVAGSLTHIVMAATLVWAVTEVCQTSRMSIQKQQKLDDIQYKIGRAHV